MAIHTNRNQSGFGVIGIVTVLVVIAVLAGVGVLIAKKHAKQATSITAATPSETAQVKASSKDSQESTNTSRSTYASVEEHATFSYPKTWTSSTPLTGSTTKNSTDTLALKSPSGSITITWIPSVAGFGNEHDDKYPLEKVVDKTPIPGASGLFVVSGTTTLDNKTYYPWIAVQDNDGIVKDGVLGDAMPFKARNAKNETTGGPANALLSTTGIRATINSPALAQEQTDNWFTTSEAQEAKQILLSLTYAQ